MLYNYHIHTKLCHHATGEMREYVERAIEGGIKTLGFSDHAPYVFPAECNGFQSVHRMLPEEGAIYTAEVRALAKEYSKDIRILCGFELEYYPDYHREEMAFLRTLSPDYLLLGQHFFGNELSGRSMFGREEELHTPLALSYYVTQVLAGLSTGDFLYLAHPDVPDVPVTEETEGEYRRLCLGAKRMDIPLEINLLGIRSGRCYPKEDFFRIAAEVGCEVVLGSDAHSPGTAYDPASEQRAMELIEKLGLRVRDADALTAAISHA